MKDNFLAAFDCAFPHQLEYYNKFSEKLEFYSYSNCRLNALAETYKNLFNCSLMSISNKNQDANGRDLIRQQINTWMIQFFNPWQKHI